LRLFGGAWLFNDGPAPFWLDGKKRRTRFLASWLALPLPKTPTRNTKQSRLVQIAACPQPCFLSLRPPGWPARLSGGLSGVPPTMWFAVFFSPFAVAPNNRIVFLPSYSFGPSPPPFFFYLAWRFVSCFPFSTCLPVTAFSLRKRVFALDVRKPGLAGFYTRPTRHSFTFSARLSVFDAALWVSGGEFPQGTGRKSNEGRSRARRAPHRSLAMSRPFQCRRAHFNWSFGPFKVPF